MKIASGEKIPFWEYNLCLALPSGDGKARQIIHDDHEKVALSMRKFTEPKLNEEGYIVGVTGPVVELTTIKAGMHCAELPDFKKFAKLNAVQKSRLTIFGHGDKHSTTVGGRSPEELAKLLKFGCGVERVGKISLVACYAGGNFDDVDVNLKDDDQLLNSFATQFFGQLESKLVATSYLTARTGAMAFEHKGGRKVERGGELQHRGKFCKFAWTRNAHGATEINAVY